jgi:hypothetical protein
MTQKRQPCSNRELKLTAALYASRQRIVDHVRATGRLPEELNLGGAHIGARLLVEARGTDITLTPDERLVYDAILRDGRLPGGAVRLVEPPPTDPDRLEEPLFRAREMKLALVGGVHPLADNRRWVMVGRSGASTRALLRARLYPFSKAGHDTACADRERLHARWGCDQSWAPFMSRVLVEGPWSRPDAVTAVWVIEGLDRPVSVGRYCFE